MCLSLKIILNLDISDEKLFYTAFMLFWACFKMGSYLAQKMIIFMRLSWVTPPKKCKLCVTKLGYWWDHDLYLVATDRSCYMSLPRSDECSLALADRAHFQFQTDVKYRTKPLTFDPSLPLHLCQCSHAIPSRGDARIISELSCACGIWVWH